ncbi:MAG TPA: tetratricopeptide repeat protein [Thermoanaerobaculia bacterium]|nr:tetratricopeptide repeat protein [Thermoanaerobaculia bacterium]
MSRTDRHGREMATARRILHASHLRPLAALLAGLTLASPALAIYVRAELEEVPVARLLANATSRTDAAPDDVDAVHNLARLHAMAYAWRLADEAPVQASGGGDPWFGYEPPWVPWIRPREVAQRGAPDDDAPSGDAETAQSHLDDAIRHYRRALELDPDHQVARLGLAWCLLERGNAEAAAQARELLRAVVEAAAPRELERGGHLGPLLAVEALDYLLPLLDAEDDRAEIARLHDLRARLEALPRAITPIAVALRSGLRAEELIDATRPVRFDLDGSGQQLEWGWIHPDAAWLVFDRNGSGEVRSALQLFGSRTFGLFFDDGYQALSLLDDDGDGTLRGAELAGLALWRDVDRDARSDAGEVMPVAALGIVAIGCRATGSQGGWLHSAGSVERSDGTRLDTWDVILEGGLRPASREDPPPAAPADP